MTFELHSQLAKDSFHLADLKLCQLRLINDQRFYWLLLVPKVANAKELTDLTPTDHQQLWQEVYSLSQVIKPLKQAVKLNIATLGNLVPQLHLHLIARFTEDAAWPNPVWGLGTAEPYNLATVKAIAKELRSACTANNFQPPINWQTLAD
ncbi:HIT family protein [Marinospirillum insulare]|uniref:Histidine triad protein n=1 Tax=Marinospirillum insulare TaxID=217169 RepID=A0ABQ5ZUY9_9GAMM|nr:HIT family protein [Marinospirillum insulare]GLR62833.1 histidine triad protein [Marinospirillum insulare]